MTCRDRLDLGLVNHVKKDYTVLNFSHGTLKTQDHLTRMSLEVTGTQAQPEPFASAQRSLKYALLETRGDSLGAGFKRYREKDCWPMGPAASLRGHFWK